MPTDIVDWIEKHPFLMAIVIFLAFFVGYQYIKSRQTATIPAAPGTGATTYYDYSQSTTTISPTGPTGPTGATGPTGQPGAPGPKGPPGPLPPQPVPKPTPAPAPRPIPAPAPRPVVNTAQYVTVQPWPAQLSTLWGISQYSNKSLAQIEALNPQYSANWNLIYAGQKVRIS